MGTYTPLWGTYTWRAHATRFQCLQRILAIWIGLPISLLSTHLWQTTWINSLAVRKNVEQSRKCSNQLKAPDRVQNYFEHGVYAWVVATVSAPEWKATWKYLHLVCQHIVIAPFIIPSVTARLLCCISNLSNNHPDCLIRLLQAFPTGSTTVLRLRADCIEGWLKLAGRC